MSVPELTAHPVSSYLIIMDFTENTTGYLHQRATPCHTLRDLERTLRDIREGASLFSGYTIRRVYLAYNVVQLPMPTEGIPGRGHRPDDEHMADMLPPNS